MSRRVAAGGSARLGPTGEGPGDLAAFVPGEAGSESTLPRGGDERLSGGRRHGNAGGERSGPAPEPSAERSPAPLPDDEPPEIRAWLAWVEARVAGAVQALGQRSDANPLRALYLSAEDVEQILEGVTGVWMALVEAEPAPSPPGRVHELRRRARLDDTSTLLLMVAAAPELDPRFERLYGFLQDDLTRRRASVALAMALAGLRPTSPAGRACLAPAGRLCSEGLLLVADEDRPFPSRSLVVPARVVSWLLGLEVTDPLVGPLAPLESEELGAEGLLPPSQLTRLAGLVTRDPGWGWPTTAREDARGDARETARGEAGLPFSEAAGAGGEPWPGDDPRRPVRAPLLYLRAGPGADALAVARAVATEAGCPLLGLEVSRLSGAEEDVAHEGTLRDRLRRECVLTGGLLVAGPLEEIAEAHAGALAALCDLGHPVVLWGRAAFDTGLSDPPVVSVDLPPLARAARRARWAARLGRLDQGELDRLADVHLSLTQLDRAAELARLAAALEGTEVGLRHLRHGVASQNGGGLGRLARRVEPAVGPADLVLPPTTRRELGELAARARLRDQVLGEWALRPGGGRGRGVVALFAGEPGTGKTMAAEALAGDLGLELYVVDLSSVVDKYVGETERNLERIFTEADGVQAVLLFDEADALFGRRSEVREAQDRFANIEVSYLLQRLERFDGLAVLSTNLRANLDEAFTRRLDAVVEFPLPGPRERRQLWSRVLSPPVPVGGDLDLDWVAARFALSGGGIRGAAITAGYLAADAGRPVGMAEVVRGIYREYRKLGRLTLEQEFGEWLARLREADGED